MNVNGLLPSLWQDWEVEKFEKVCKEWNNKIKDIDFSIYFSKNSMCEVVFNSVEFGYKITSYYCNIHDISDVLELIIRLK